MGHDNLIKNVICKEVINLMTIILVDLGKEIKLKISRLKYLGSRLFSLL